jgi:flagellar protein FlaG
MDISTLRLPNLPSIAEPTVPAASVRATPAGEGPPPATAPAAGTAKARFEPSLPDLKTAVEAGSKALQSINQSLEFQIDDKSKQSVVKVVDTQTQEVIRQIPSPEFLRMAQNIDEYQAHLIHEKA